MSAAPAGARVALRLSNARTTYATGRGSLRDGHATVKLRGRRALLHTRYTLSLVLTSSQAPGEVSRRDMRVRLG